MKILKLQLYGFVKNTTLNNNKINENQEKSKEELNNDVFYSITGRKEW